MMCWILYVCCSWSVGYKRFLKIERELVFFDYFLQFSDLSSIIVWITYFYSSEAVDKKNIHYFLLLISE